jgi:hypothetical protein
MNDNRVCPSIAQANRIGRAACKRNALEFAAYYNSIALMIASWNPKHRRMVREVVLSVEMPQLIDCFNYGTPARQVAQQIAVSHDLQARGL